MRIADIISTLLNNLPRKEIILGECPPYGPVFMMNIRGLNEETQMKKYLDCHESRSGESIIARIKRDS